MGNKRHWSPQGRPSSMCMLPDYKHRSVGGEQGRMLEYAKQWEYDDVSNTTTEEESMEQAMKLKQAWLVEGTQGSTKGLMGV